MNATKKSIIPTLLLCAGMVATPPAPAEDIDIFVGSSGGAADNPNVLIVLDNTSNWSQQAQHWPGGITQGQAEVNAIKNIVGTLSSSVNVGLMMYTTGSGGGNDGGYIRQAVKPMTSSNISTFQSKLTTIYNNINDTTEKVNSSMPYGNILFDAYKYFGGYTSPTHALDGVAGSPTDSTHFGTTAYAASGKVPSALADSSGYTSTYTTFSSPISSANSCAKNYIIFIGNGFPNADNTTLLSNVGGDTGKIAVPNFTTTSNTTYTDKGYMSSCSSSCVTSDYTATLGGTLECDTTRTTGSCSPASKKRYMVREAVTTSSSTPTGTYSIVSPTSKERYADEWARFLYHTDVSSAPGQQNVVTYSIDVYKDQQSGDQTALLMSMAKVGGGKYFAATDENAILNALRQIFAEIQSVNTTFASASLPVNATNRAQNENQVFIGMFRPDPDAYPRWFGNMKRYQLVASAGDIQLGDAAGNAAVNTQTGFVTDCATSWWTTNSGTYWQTVPTNPTPAGACTTTSYDKFSDSPDGPRVEKGAVAEVLRMGNNPPYSDTPATRPWSVNRTVYTLSGSSLVSFTTASSGLSSSVVDFVLGKDVNDEDANGNVTETRPSIHGDVIHSRPLPINYGSSSGVTVYYGANDGTLRAVNASSGMENWAFVAPEFYSSLERLKTNSPLVNYPNMPSGVTPTPTAKNYFFDGSIGLYQNGDSSQVWIYPTMRRGGRMVYAFDVSSPTSPVFKWALGCPSLSSDSGCSSGASGFGQTWSLPNVAFIKSYSTGTPVIVMGGGYDACEDANSSSPSCSSTKGNAVHVINANTGAIIKSFATTRSVPADVTLIDVTNDGYVDYAYAADTGGNLYRIDFTNTASVPNNWTITRIGYTNGSGRKFLYGPAALPAGNNKVYLAIGSGDREHPLQSQYPYTDVTNRFYLFLDDLTVTTTTNMDDASVMNDYTSSTNCDTSPILTTSSKKGWFMDLNQYGQGEQTVTSAVIVGGMVTFSTNRPIPAASGTCATVLGEARGYWVNLLNASGAVTVTGGSCGGSRSATFVGGGLPPSPVIGTVPVNGKPTTVVIGAVQKSGSASSPISPQQVKPTISGKRKIIYWKTNADN